MPIRYLSGVTVDSNTLVVDAANDRVGIGTTTPGTLLHLVQSSGPTIRLVRTSNRFDITADNDFMELNARDASTYMIFKTADTERMRITSAGNVGIGTTSPAQKVQIGDGTATGSQYFRIFNSASDIYVGQSGGTIFGFSANSAGFVLSDNTSFPFGIGTFSAQPFVIGTTNAERMRITAGGNVGIGTTNPGDKLHVNAGGTGGIRIQADSEPSLYLNTTDGAANATLFNSYGNVGLVGYATSTNYIMYHYGGGGTLANQYTYFQTAGAERMRINGAGNVGIGTTSPAYKLSVNESTTNPIAYFGLGPSNASSRNSLIILQSGTIPQNGSDTTGEVGFLFKHSYGTGGVNGTANGGYIESIRESVFGITSQVNTALIFGTSAANTDNERMRINSAGNVGIGNSSPQANGASAVLDVGNGSGGTLNLRDTNTGIAAEGFNQIFGGDNRMYLYAGASGASSYMQFYTNDVERMRIHTNGNVGIGTTSPNRNLTVSGNGTLLGLQSSTVGGYSEIEMTANGVGAGYIFKNSAGYSGYAGAGALNIYNSGSIGFHTASVTNAMFIASGTGNVGIGTTSPAVRLDVVGANSAEGQLYVGNTNVEYSAGINFTTSGTNRGFVGWRHTYSTAPFNLTGIHLFNTDNSNIVFGTNNLVRAVIDTNGNVGIGTTSPSYKLQVEGAGRFSNGASGTLIVKHNYFFHQPNWGIKLDGDTGSSGGYLSQYVDIGGFELAQGATYYGGGPWLADSNSTTYSAVVGNGGTLIFSTNSGLTAGGTFFPSERMRITSAGNVGIGTSAPTIYGGRGMEVSGAGQTGIRISDTVGGGKVEIGSDSSGGYIQTAAAGNALTFYTGNASTLVMRMTSAGNVGIGTTSPAANAKLTIDGSAGANTSQIDMVGFSSTAKGHLGQFADGIYLSTNYYYSGGQYNDTATLGQAAIVLSAGATSTSSIDFNLSDAGANSPSNKVRITSAGNVGIGTTAPGYKLDVSGNIRAYTASSGVSPRLDLGGTIIAEGGTRAGLYILTSGTAAGSYGSIWWGNGNTNTDAFISVANDTRAMAFGTADGTRMVITSAGNVGIGTTAPGERLVVNAASGSNAIIYAATDTGQSGLKLLAGTGATNRATRVDFLNGVSSGTVPRWTLINDYNQNGTNDFRFVKDDQSTSVLTLLQDGNVGIGTTSPLGPLEVYRSNTGGLGGHIIVNNNGTAVGNETAVIFGDGASNGFRAAISSTTENSPYYGDLKFKTGANVYSSLTTKMIITGAGNVGIGTTAPGGRLSVIGTISQNTTLQAANTWANLILDSSASSNLDTNFVYANAGTLVWDIYNDWSTNDLSINTKASGGAGIVATFKQNGNVGIGTTSPGALLHVAGVPRFDASGGAPSDTSAPVTQDKYYGTNSVVLTSPNNWLKVDINGTAYVIPAYSI